MYTNKEQTDRLLFVGLLPDSCDMVVLAGRSKKDPYKDWIARPKLQVIKEASKKNDKDALEGKNWMPVWSEYCLIDLLPHYIKDPKEGKVYELHIVKRMIPGRGMYKCVSYFDNSTGTVWRSFMHPTLIRALCSAVCEILCSDTYEIGNFVWDE